MLKESSRYSIAYTITTINGIELSSPEYIITVGQDGHIDDKNGFLTAILNQENGCVNLHFKKSNGNIATLQAGDYIVTRASSKDDFNNWIQLTKIIVSNDIENPMLFIDYTVEQGVSYRYGLQLVKPSGWLTARQEAKYYLNQDDSISMDSLFVDFEDAYLFDGERQLCIKYNPKISSFKNTLLENKIDTLGGKHPFIFRNGNVNYKEFSISGLISMLMDENGSFAATRLKDRNDEAPDYIGASGRTNLTGDNFYKERQFKLEVLDWLTNGQPKLFRSPGEGNYIIRAMNTSLSPNDTLGRMLHTFTCTAYEIADFTMANLYKYKFISNEIKKCSDKKMIISERKLVGIANNFSIGLPLFLVRFENQHLACTIEIKFMDKKIEVFDIGNSTGVYEFQISKDNPIESIRFLDPDNFEANAKIIYGSYANIKNLTHDNPYKIKSVNTRVRQISTDSTQGAWPSWTRNIDYCYFIKLIPKSIIDVAYDEKQCLKYVSFDEDGNIIISDEDAPETNRVIYRILQSSGEHSYKCGTQTMTETQIIYAVNINGTSIPLDTRSDTESITGTHFQLLENVGQITYLAVFNGVICEVVYKHLERETL